MLTFLKSSFLQIATFDPICFAVSGFLAVNNLSKSIDICLNIKYLDIKVIDEHR